MLDERRQADLFLADLLGTTPRRPRAVRPAPPARPAVAPASGGWSRPDLIFDRRAFRGASESEWAEELSDEGWETVAEPHSATPAASLRPNDVVVERALGEGRLAFVKVLGDDISVESLYGPGGLIREDILVLRQQVPTFEQIEDVRDPEYLEDLERPRSGTGEAMVHLAMLKAHAARGFVYDLSGPNCVLRWTQIPPSYSGAIDVVVHFHGYRAHNKMKLADKAAASGLDLASPGVSRPTLGLIPQGRAFASRIPNTDGFDFPAISSRDELKKFIEAGIDALKAQIGSAGQSLTAGRVVLTGHSGGGAALNLVLRSVGAGEGVRDVHYFDATYGGTAVLVDERGWLRASLERDAQAVQAASSDAERRRIMAERGGSLRLLFIDGTGTAPTARAVDQFIAARLKSLVPDAAVRQFLRGYYRAQKVARPRETDHGRVPAAFGGRLLSDRAHNLDPDAIDLTPIRAAKEELEELEDVGQLHVARRSSATAPASLETVRSTIESVLQEFRNIPVSIPGGGSLAVEVPYFINKPSSPSRLRGEQKRPALVRNGELARLYRGLPARAKVGKSYPADIRAFLKGAVDASAVPGQSSGVTAKGLKSFLSDMGVGVDCSGFVSQALNACMAAMGRTETIDTSSGYLRGGAGANERQFEVITRPRDLRPGDTMWKTGHIRIISRVDPQGDGSVHFTTAESSSVELVGPVAKTWKCPAADTFTGIQVDRGGTFRAISEVNVFSRYRPLADALGFSLPSRTSEDDGPAPLPTSTRSAPPPPPMPQPRPMPAPTPPVSPAPAVPRTLTQAEVSRLAAIDFGNAADIDAFFSRKGASGFTGWFNTTWAAKAPFKRASGAPIRMGATPVIHQRFTAFWNSIPLAYDRPRINAIDFACLMCIVLNETGGDFWAHPERCGAGRGDARGPHPGLAYAFDKIVGVKASYNTLAGNKKAGELFNDADYIRAHGTLGSGSRLANRGNEFGGAWNSQFYPQADISTAEDLTANGFIMQADFYKFRGRGVIQTTSRGAYLAAVSFVQGYTGTNSVLTDFKNRWTGMTRDVAATISTNADWDRIFAQGEMLAKAVRLHSGTGPTDYLTMDTQAPTLLDVPAPQPKGVPKGKKGSIYFMGRRISGSYSYGSGAYRDRVLAMLAGMLSL